MNSKTAAKREGNIHCKAVDVNACDFADGAQQRCARVVMVACGRQGRYRGRERSAAARQPWCHDPQHRLVGGVKNEEQFTLWYMPQVPPLALRRHHKRLIAREANRVRRLVGGCFTAAAGSSRGRRGGCGSSAAETHRNECLLRVDIEKGNANGRRSDGNAGAGGRQRHGCVAVK